MKKTVIAVVLCAIAIIIGLSLPKIVANSKDEELNGTVMNLNEIEDRTDQTANAGLSISDKIKIISSPDTSYVVIEYGKYRNEKDVMASVIEFSDMFNGIYVSDEEINEIDDNCTVSASVISENYGEGRSFICWNVTVTLGKDIITFAVDDETGKVLKFTKAVTEKVAVYTDNEAAECVMLIASRLAEYYGFTVDGFDYTIDDDCVIWRIRYDCGDVEADVLLDYNNYGWVINEMPHDDAEISIN